MLPWLPLFFVIVFLADMKLLPCTAAEAHQGFLRGDYFTKETQNAFNQIADEHVNFINLDK